MSLVIPQACIQRGTGASQGERHDDGPGHLHRGRAAARPRRSPSRSSPAACGATAASTTTAPTSRPARSTACPAIEAWQAQARGRLRHRDPRRPARDRGPRTTPTSPRPASSSSAGVPEPLIATLTRIGTVEGFGANIRLLAARDMQQHFDEDIAGTAIDHLGRGLFEAHGRDEAGWEEEAGHKDMWFAARDIAFESPDRQGRHRGDARPHGLRPARRARRHRPRAACCPTTSTSTSSSSPTCMIRVLLIEIAGVPHLRVGRGRGCPTPTSSPATARPPASCRYIRADETPHVGYLKTALTEMRDRTWIGASGKKHDGADMIGTLWDARPRASRSAPARRSPARRSSARSSTGACSTTRRRRPPRRVPRARPTDAEAAA